MWFGSLDSSREVVIPSSTITKYNLCWVSSVVRKFKSIDDMESLMINSAPSNKGKINVASINFTNELPTIYMINPPPDNPILLENTNIEFGGIGSFRPAKNGIIQVVELLYTDSRHSDFVENVKMSITFT